MMSITQYFQAHPELSAQLEAARESFSKQNEKCSFTAYVLNQKIVFEEDYLAWAQQFYGLVILNNDYFQMHSPDLELWDRWKGTYSWNGECLPVGEWDGVLFVGCLEKPEGFDPSIPVCFTLCSPVHLKTWNHRYLSPVAARIPSFEEINESLNNPVASTPAVAPAEVLLAPVEAVAPPVDKILTLELVDDGDSSEENKESQGEDQDNQFGNGTLGAFLPDDQLVAPTENSFLLNIHTLKPQTGNSESSPLLSPTLTPNEKASPTLVAVPPLSVLKTPNEDGPKEEAAKRTPPKLETAPNPPIVFSQIKAQPKNSTPVQSAPQAPFYLTKLSSVFKELDSEIRTACEPLLTNFEKYLVLSVSEGGDVAGPLLWSDGFNPGVPNDNLNLKIPSMFYIVATTYKPFHGPISVNDVNEKFFDDWNMSLTPGHATLVPILQKDRLIGIVLALGESTAYNNQVLRSVAKVAQEITHKVNSKVQIAAA